MFVNSLSNPWRRIEDKMDAKGLANYPASLRCHAPPSAKRVPMQYPGWLVYCDGSVEDNLWTNCQMMLDRTCTCLGVKNRFQNTFDFDSIWKLPRVHGLYFPEQDDPRMRFICHRIPVCCANKWKGWVANGRRRPQVPTIKYVSTFFCTCAPKV